ncbi:MAG TPA: hypothetical protein VE567_05795 [Sphingomonas sp.]|nr:hypothetical protein [Sphingomonas sp.]
MKSFFEPTQAERRTVIAAYQRAAARGRHAPECRLAAIAALSELYPDMALEVAAAEAVRIVTSDLNFLGIGRSSARAGQSRGSASGQAGAATGTREPNPPRNGGANG